MSAKIIIYSTSHCPYCVRAKALLERKGMQFTEILIDKDDKLKDEMIEKAQRYTVPQIFINDSHVGGFDDLYALECSGKLDDFNV
ncbi:MAG: glutaredoxin 3 [Legionella sp.]|nr:glutaredoxin 3 [Legionella sp.]